jgi:hypothetical protein
MAQLSLTNSQQEEMHATPAIHTPYTLTPYAHAIHNPEHIHNTEHQHPKVRLLPAGAGYCTAAVNPTGGDAEQAEHSKNTLSHSRVEALNFQTLNPAQTPRNIFLTQCAKEVGATRAQLGRRPLACGQRLTVCTANLQYILYAL